MSDFEKELSVFRSRHDDLMDALGLRRDATLEGVVLEDIRGLRPEMAKARADLQSARQFDELARAFWQEKPHLAAKLWKMGRGHLKRAHDAEQQLADLQAVHDATVRAVLIRDKALKIAAKESGGDAVCFLWLGKAQRFLVENGTISDHAPDHFQLSLSSEFAVKRRYPNATVEFNQSGDGSWILVKTDHDEHGDAVGTVIGCGLTESEAWESAARRLKQEIVLTNDTKTSEEANAA